MHTALLLFITILTLSGITHAAHAAGDTQADLNQSAHQHYLDADAALNTAYARLMTFLSPERQQQLKHAQRAWLKYRDAHAEFQASPYQGGTIQPLIYSQALLELTKYRTRQLNAIYQDESTR